MKRARVNLGSRSYDILVGSGLIGSSLDHLQGMRGWQRVALLTDTNVSPLYADLLSKQFENLWPVDRLTVEAGERSKSWSVAGELLEQLASKRVRRHDLILTLGGGVISDLGGFLASTYLRGVRVIHVPTTLLGQVDAAIGGKTGVNLSAGKNLAGTFYQPSAVLCDVETLFSLPQREFRSGLAEVIKYGLCFDPEILSHFGVLGLSGHSDGASGVPRATRATRADLWDPRDLEELVYRCASIKADVVSADEADQSSRQFLNYGHTFGHALEAAGEFNKWSHGEAISVGMVFAASLASRLGMLGQEVEEVHRRALASAGLPVSASFDRTEVAHLWEMDKKRDSRQRWVLLEALGRPVIRSDVQPADIAYALDAVQD